MGLLDATAKGLDWPVVVEAWAQQARTSLGGAAVRALSPLPDRAAVAEALDGCAEVLALEATQTFLPVGGVTDVRAEVDAASKGIVLEGPVLLGAASCLRALLQLAAMLDGAAETAPTLARYASRISIDPFVTETIERAFDRTGLLSGVRYPELEDLRSSIARLHEEVRGTLDRLVKGDEFGDDLLQDRFWTVRDNRYVLPIKSHAKRWDLGIVHDTSGTGKTVFVEPHAVIELNNRLRLAEGRLRAAEHAILAELSRDLGTQRGALFDGVAAAIRIDLAASRAGLAKRLGAVRPSVGDGERLRLLSARHPVLVLRGVDVIANDLEVGPEHPVLVLSGPNAGGKTVALKTLGLFAQLVRHGCFVPAALGSRVDWFAGVFAMIGDQQSVEGDLSSFSAHLVALREMLDVAGPGQLLLLDEVASGTDPTQGQALAQAALEALAERGARVVVTTHFAGLKVLATVDPRFTGAAVQYDDGRPTYRVLAHASGESHALGIAKRVGLPAALLERAETLIGASELELGRLLSALEAERSRAEAATTRARDLERHADLLAKKTEARELEIARRAKELEAQGAASFLQRLRNAEKAIGQVVADLQRSPSHGSVTSARATLDALASLAPGAVGVAPAEATFAVGDRVRHRKLGQVGEVVAVGDGLQVRMGAVTVRARAEDLEADNRGRPAPRRRGGTTFDAAPRAAAIEDALRMPGNTLDLRGQRVEEAWDASEKFFDRAVLGGQDTVFLLHGHGTGALKDGVRGWLRGSPYVASFAAASEEQGGDAFTVVHLRS